MDITCMGIDLAKNVFQLHGVDRAGKSVVKKQLRRTQMLPYFGKLPPMLIGMEACGSSHYWARELGKLGHDVRLMSPQFVKPYVKSGKNDANDAEAICEAVSRPTMRFVQVKSVEQQVMQAEHRIRARLIRARTVSVRVGYYLSTDNIIDTTDTFLGYRPVNTLAAGTNNVNSGYPYYATVPATMAPGVYYLGAIADYNGLQTETDESNNALASVGPLIAIGPDLVMTGIASNRSTAAPGSGITLTDTLKNKGAAATGSGCRQIGYYLSVDAVITVADTLIGSRQYCGALAANTSNNGTSNVTVPASMVPGTYYLGAIADYTATETEADKNNNSLAGAPLLISLLPNAPGTPTATGGNASANVSFTAPADSGGAAITGYTVVSLPAGGVDEQAGIPVLNHHIIGLANGTAYTFTVTARNNSGPGPASAASNSITPATVPGAPLIGTATAKHAQASVSFTAPTDNGGAAITGYIATAAPGGQTGICTASPCIITGLVDGTAYTLTVAASNSAGTGPASAASNSVVPSIAVPGAPQSVSATGGATRASVSFNPPASDGGSPILGYTVTASPAGPTDSNANGTALTHLITGLVGGTTYTFTVTASNLAGSGPASLPSNRITANATEGRAIFDMF